MPCGGIYPIQDEQLENDKPISYADNPTCWTCGKPVDKYDLFLEEWDAYIHYDCVLEFLKTDEGKMLFEHGHDLILMCRDTVKKADENKGD